MKIIAYLKPHCRWSRDIRGVFHKHGLSFQDIDIVNNPSAYREMLRTTGQSLCPCVSINGVVLADISGEEVEDYLLRNDLVNPGIEFPSSLIPPNHPSRGTTRIPLQTEKFF